MARRTSIARLLHRRCHEERHCERRHRVFTAVMRHFLIAGIVLRMPRSPLPLARRMPVRAAATALIPRPGFPPTPAPLLPRAIPGAVPLAVIAVAANAHPYAAAPALVCPERPLSHRNAIPMKDWTMPGDACIKEPWSCLSHAPHRRPGVDRQIPPGPSLIRRRLKNNQDFGARRRQTINRSLSAAALLMGRTISGEQGRTDFGKRLRVIWNPIWSTGGSASTSTESRPVDYQWSGK